MQRHYYIIAGCTDGDVRLVNSLSQWSIVARDNEDVCLFNVTDSDFQKVQCYRNWSDLLEGRVEICKNNQYETVCDDRWDQLEAKVVCRQLGYTTGNIINYKLLKCVCV